MRSRLASSSTPADRVVVRFIWHGARPRPEMNMDLTTVFTVRKGKIRGLEFFWDHADALETLGPVSVCATSRVANAA